MSSRSGYRRVILASLPLMLAQHAFAQTPVAEATFECHGGKTIAATFYADSVELKLSDGRDMTVPQAMSGSGARYANADESFVFWNKGNTAFITEGGDDKQTYGDCVEAK